MYEVELEVLVLSRLFEPGLQLCQALGHPSLSRWGSRRAEGALLESLRLALAEATAQELLPLLAPGSELEARPLRVEVRPQRDTPGWRQPRVLELWALWGRSGRHGWALVPALELTVVAASPAELQALLPEQVAAALQRKGLSRSLRWLTQLERECGLQFERCGLRLELDPVPQQERPEPVLEKVARRCGRRGLPCLHREPELQRLARHLTAPVPRSVLLVGPSGVGKTALFHQLAREAERHRLGASLLLETSGSRLMAGQVNFGAWQKRCQQVVDEAAERNAILHLGNLFELSQVARHSTNPLGMAGFFRGPLESGRLLAVAECTPSQWERLESEQPQLLQAFQTLELKPLDASACRSLLARRAPQASPEALDQLLQLHQRWGQPEHWPGPLLRFLEELMDGSRSDPWKQICQAFSQKTGLPLAFLDDAVELPSESMRQWFAARVRNQPQAIERVVERLAAVKAGLNRQGRPVGSFLLVGPTGVGKTELARCLAEFLYQHRQRLTRLDMSEYSTPWAVTTLVGVPGSEQAGILVEKVREAPFQVILFDEIEKAHPDFFDLLLQVLGDGRLTDHLGQSADFSSSLVLMTSNLGSQSFVKGSLGFRQEEREDFMEAVRAAFRPELLNRIDEVLPFQPLDRDTIAGLAQRELEQLQLRLQAGRGRLSWRIEASVVDFLVEHGYDRRYGARPLKRSLDRFLLAPLAHQLLLYAADQELEIALGTRTVPGQLRVEVRPAGAAAQSDVEKLRQQRWAQRATELRRRLQRIQKGPVVTELLNARARLKSQKQKPGRPPQRFPQQSLLDQVSQLLRQAQQLEEQILLELSQSTLISPEPALEELHRNIQQRVTELYLSTLESPHRGVVAIYSPWPWRVLELARCYEALARERKGSVRWLKLTVRKGKVADPSPEDPNPHFEREWLEALPARFSGLGLVGEFQGRGLAALLQPESGPHHFLEGDASQLCRVEVSSAPLSHPDPNTPWMSPAYTPPTGAHRQAFFENQPRLRLYHCASRRVEDPRRPGGWNWSGALELGPWLEQWLYERALEACLP